MLNIPSWPTLVLSRKKKESNANSSQGVLTLDGTIIVNNSRFNNINDKWLLFGHNHSEWTCQSVNHADATYQCARVEYQGMPATGMKIDVTIDSPVSTAPIPDDGMQKPCWHLVWKVWAWLTCTTKRNWMTKLYKKKGQSLNRCPYIIFI